MSDVPKNESKLGTLGKQLRPFRSADFGAEIILSFQKSASIILEPCTYLDDFVINLNNKYDHLFPFSSLEGFRQAIRGTSVPC